MQPWCVDLGSKVTTRGKRRRTVMQAHLLNDLLVIVRIAHHRDRIVVLRGGAQHARATDINVLNSIGKGYIGLGNRLLKLVEVHAHQVDHLDAVLGSLGHVLLRIATRQQTAVHLGVQRLHTAVHHLGESGELLDGRNRHARLLNGLGGTTRGDDFDTKLIHQRAGKFDHARFVGHRDQRARDLYLRTHATPPYEPYAVAPDASTQLGCSTNVAHRANPRTHQLIIWEKWRVYTCAWGMSKRLVNCAPSPRLRLAPLLRQGALPYAHS